MHHSYPPPPLPPPHQVYQQLIVLSAHYNTQLSLLAALDIESTPDADLDIPWLSSIPQLASVLTFELHQQGDQEGQGGLGLPASYYVRAVVQDGPDAPYVVIPLPCSAESDARVAELVLGMWWWWWWWWLFFHTKTLRMCINMVDMYTLYIHISINMVDMYTLYIHIPIMYTLYIHIPITGAGACTWESFSRLLSRAAIPTVAEWCSACNNNSTTACQLANLRRAAGSASG